eukprot:TRINITY_DN1383_c0_g1_i1.p1 TRINITY_DN1383_c0_g1~~TRINITY_DN1383_c0_g1_i1.p1  ORF type:complete len:134 (+),score=43.83 TRINITY_DN1383_c0_g1_i1:404-805(+)
MSLGAIVVYDVTNKGSFKNITMWLSEIEKHSSEDVEILIIGNKIDLNNQREVTYEEGAEFCRNLGLTFIETSSKNSTNVDEAFETLAKKILKRKNGEKNSKKNVNSKITNQLHSKPIGNDNNNNNNENSTSCC